MDRFRDTGEVIEDFLDEILVRCPRCGGRAVILPRPELRPDPLPGGILFVPRRVTCPHCAYTAEWARSGIRYPIVRDPYFHLPLWLQVPCAGETLWAYNASHLAFLERFVRAEVREPSRPRGAEPRNRTMASRLPTWIKSGKRRDEILAAIAKLRASLNT